MSVFEITSETDGGHAIKLWPLKLLRELGESLSNTPLDNPGPIPDGPSPRQVYRTALSAFEAAYEKAGLPHEWRSPAFHLPQVPGPPLSDPQTALTPPDPQQVLDQIVAAINSAEAKLNIQNFVIASGVVEAKLTLPVGGVNVTFNITPKPYS